MTTARGHRTRQRILDYIRQHPGSNKLEIQLGLGMGWGTVVYNAEIMERSGTLIAHHDRGNARLFDANVPGDHVRYISALLNPQGLAILRAMERHGETSTPAVSRKLQVSRKVVRRAMSHLHENGLVERLGTHSPTFRLTPECEQILQNGKVGKYDCSALLEDPRNTKSNDMTGELSPCVTSNSPRGEIEPGLDDERQQPAYIPIE